MATRPSVPLKVYLETGGRRVFACAVDWPGWCRSGKDEETALGALAEYAPRYAVVTAEAGLDLPAGAAERFEVVDRVPGSATTDFGAPAAVASGDAGPLTPAEGRRAAALVAASWSVLDRVVATSPGELRKGPRGGGRDRDAIAAHVIGAEAAYARKIGIRRPVPDPGDAAAVVALREAILEVVRAGAPVPPEPGRGWPVRYAARRIAWHALDHAWEIEDRRPG